MSANPWNDIELDLEVPPLLLLGTRTAPRRLGSFRVELGADVAATLSELAAARLADLRSGDRAAYSPDDTLEPGEYFAIEVGDLPVPAHGAAAESGEEAIADLLRIVRTADTAEVLPADELPHRFLFYAICPAISNGSRIAFVRKRDPHALLRTPGMFLRRNAGALTEIDRSPEFILDLRTDLVVGPEIAVFDPKAFADLFSDASLLLASAATLAGALAPGLGMRMTVSGLEELTKSASTKLRVATRLNRIEDRLGLLRSSEANLSHGFEEQGLDPSDFLTADGELDCPPGRAPELLDALEGRYFSDALTPERRRATSFRRV
jgi:hypothetical protein